MESESPRVLISYSHDSPEHEQRVLTLAARLRGEGVDCMIDQYVLVPGEGWTLWMERQIEDSDFVLMVCTETYFRRVKDENDAGGLGVRWEGRLIYQALYQNGRRNTKFIPVLFEASDFSHIPGPVRDTNFYLVQTERGYEDLYRRITDQSRAVKPELGKLRSLPPAERKSEGAVGREMVLSNLPDRNPFFTGRENVLVQLREALVAQGRAALSGLGGVGKTQTAVEYAHRHLDGYGYTLWTIADSREAIASGYVKIAGLLHLSESTAKEQTLAVDAVKNWLSSHRDWLLILDNADDLGMARSFIPFGMNGHVVLTTRAQAVGPVARRLEIQEMGAEEGALFLLRRAWYVAEDAPRESATEADQATAKEIATQLGGLPLALDQAGAYIEETGCGLSGYLDLYRTHDRELLGIRGALAIDQPPVATTWALSFEKIEQANPAAAELLRFCAFLHPDGMPEELFSKGAKELGPVLGPVGSDLFALNNAILEILKFSLLRRDPNAHTFEIHRLVQAALQAGMDEATQRVWAERAVRAVNRGFPEVNFDNWNLCKRLVTQARVCAELVNHWSFEFPEAARLLHQAGFYLYERGRYADAKPLLERALAILEKVLGPKHPNVARSLNTLAELYYFQGQYAKAEPLYQRALAIREKSPEHPDLAVSLNNLARLYDTYVQYTKAESLYKRALAILEKALGPDHPNVATSLSGIGWLYYNQGQHAKAEPLLERALAIREKALNPDHPDVARSLYHLAGLYYNQDQYAKAKPLYHRALAIREKILGPKHPGQAAILNKLGMLYYKQGQYAKAKPLLERALAIRKKALRPNHPDVATSLENYALCLRAVDRAQEAEPLETRARAIRDKSSLIRNPAGEHGI